MRCAIVAIRINKGKNINSWESKYALLTTYVIINEEHFSRHILKHNWLGANEAEDENVIQ